MVCSGGCVHLGEDSMEVAKVMVESHKFISGY